ncbi:uncharacterized protein Dana_GF12803, isoform C [Drosophila ananassae]|uniref:glycogenin glucosyltransferase n=1 Tax=Drosophila ananassae TaxID=7217 RepID=A0A0P8XMX0_DROAN|nr:uncharacterized protein Dana_GF12803, isoform C [Drosophila ananassae]
MSKFAWVTLTTNDTYSLGALVLAHSLKRANTAHQLAVLVTPTVSEAMRDRLKDVYNVVQEVNVLDSQDAANLALLARPELGVTFTKLHCWRLTQFEKCVFLDADTLVLQNCDELFEREELSAAPDVSWPDCFNSGVFVFKPSAETFGQITEFAVKNGSFDGGDQGLLNQFFADWATADIKKHLPFVYNVTAYASYCYLPAFKQFRDKIKILHFAGKLKPWLIQFNSETKTASVSSDYAHAQDLIQLWWNIFCDNVIQSLSTDMCLCLNLTHSQSDYASDEQWLDQDYEQRQQHEYYQQQRLHHHLLHERQFRDPWADYYENLEKEQRQADEHHHNPSQDNGNANANAYESATEWHNDDACHPPSQSPPPPIPPQTQSSTANAKEDSASVDVNSNELNHPPPEHATSASDFAMPNASASATPMPTPTPTPSSTPTPHHSVHSQTVENATNHQQEQEVAAKTAPEAGLAGALSQLKIGQQRTTEQEAYENLMRRQCWESGQIDYSGADSFDNIWKKITQTLEKKPDADQTDNDNDSDTANTLSQKQLLTEVEEELKKSLPQHAEIKASTNKELQKKVLAQTAQQAQPAQLDQPRPNKLPANASSAADATSSHSKQNPQRRSQESQPETKPKPKPEPQPQQPQHITLPAGNRNGSGSSNVSKNGKQRAGRKLK